MATLKEMVGHLWECINDQTYCLVQKMQFSIKGLSSLLVFGWRTALQGIPTKNRLAWAHRKVLP